MQSVPGQVGVKQAAGPGRVVPLLLAGIALASTSLAVGTPAGSTDAAVEHLAVQLTSGLDDVAADYQAVFATATANLQQLTADAQAASAELTQQVSANLSGYGDIISTALTGVVTNLQYSLDGGWYGGDDGFVFGLFGGTVTHGDVTASGSTLQELADALSQGKLFDAFGVFDKWSLETVDHTMKALLGPFVSTGHGAPTIPGDFLHTLANIYDTFGTYSFLKSDLAEGLMAPLISVNAGLAADIDAITTDLSSGNLDQAVTDALKMPADLLGNLLNGFVQTNPFNGDNTPFAGLFNDGSLLQDVLVTWPQMLATALGASAADTGSAAASAGGDALEGLLGLL